MAIDWKSVVSQLTSYSNNATYAAEVAPLLSSLNSAGPTYDNAGNDSPANRSAYGVSVSAWWGTAGASAAWAELDRWARYCFSLAERADQAAAATAFGVTGMLAPPSANVIMLGGPTLTFDGTAHTITRSAGDWIDEGFAVGDVVRIYGATSAGNNTSKTITALTDTVMTFASGLVSETDSDVTVSASIALSFPAPAPLPPDVTMQTQSTLNARVSAARAMTSVLPVVQSLLVQANTNWTTVLGLRPTPQSGPDSASTSAINALNAAIASAQAWLSALNFK